MLSLQSKLTFPFSKLEGELGSKPRMIRSKVDLPDPELPRMPTTELWETSKLMLLRTLAAAVYPNDNSVTVMCICRHAPSAVAKILTSDAHPKCFHFQY
jgi:hypothetical protein